MSADAEQLAGDPLGPERATFIVRLVRERRPGTAWRGEVEYLQRGERRLAADPQRALAHLTAWLTALRRDAS